MIVFTISKCYPCNLYVKIDAYFKCFFSCRINHYYRLKITHVDDLCGL